MTQQPLCVHFLRGAFKIIRQSNGVSTQLKPTQIAVQKHHKQNEKRNKMRKSLTLHINPEEVWLSNLLLYANARENSQDIVLVP